MPTPGLLHRQSGKRRGSGEILLLRWGNVLDYNRFLPFKTGRPWTGRKATSGLAFDALEHSEPCCFTSKEAEIIEEEQGPSVLEDSVLQRMFCAH